MTTLLTVDHDVFLEIIDKLYKRRKELNDILFNTIVANYRFTNRFALKKYYWTNAEWMMRYNCHCFLHTSAGHYDKSPIINNKLPRSVLIKTLDLNNVPYKDRWNRKEMCAALIKHEVPYYFR